MRRRDFLSASLGAALAAPRIARAAPAVLKYIPQSDLATLDPPFTTASVPANTPSWRSTRPDGMDNSFQPQPQMVAGHTVSDDSKVWELTLRDGLCFHDGTPVLARDAVASIQRWWQRDVSGGVSMARTEEISAPPTN